MSQQNVAAARSALAAFNEGGIDALLDPLDPQIESVSVRGILPDAEDHVGHEGGGFETITELFDDLHCEPLELIDAGDQVFVAARITGTGKASGIPSDGGPFHVATVRAGKAVRLESYTERADALEAAGLRSTGPSQQTS